MVKNSTSSGWLLLLFTKTLPLWTSRSLPRLLFPWISDLFPIILLDFASHSSERLGQSPTITSELVHSVYPGPICPPLVCSRWLCTKQSIWLSFPLDYSVSSFLSSILHLIYSWSIYCWGDVHNEYPWAFIKLGFEQFLFPLLVLDVCWIWSLAYVKLTFCQHLPHTNTSLSLLNMLV